MDGPSAQVTAHGSSHGTRPRSGEHFFYHLAGDVGQAEVATLVAVRQFEVIETEEMQERGVEIVDVGGGRRRQRRTGHRQDR